LHRLTSALALLLALIGCAEKPVVLSEVYRAPSAPIYSNATLDTARLIGDWQQVAAFGALDCPAGAARFDGAPGALSIAYQLCLSGQILQGEGALTPVGPGRFAAPGLPGDLWLLWVDTDVRTLVFGTPSGAYGFVLNRGGDLPGDRARALREILDWNSYDLTALNLY
jgi:apolipoprotein D and lipocalin family protein